MKTFVYKTLFIFICIFLLFQLTIGAKLKQLNNELAELKSKKNIEIIKGHINENISDTIRSFLPQDKLVESFLGKSIHFDDEDND